MSELLNLGLVLLGRAEAAEAEPMFRRALAIRRKQFGDRHPSLGTSLANLGASLVEQGKYEEAERTLAEGLAVTNADPAGQGGVIARLSLQLARVHVARNDATGAETLLRDALRRQEALLRPDDWVLAGRGARVPRHARSPAGANG